MWPFNNSKKRKQAIYARLSELADQSSKSKTIADIEAVWNQAKNIMSEAEEFKSTSQQFDYLLTAIQLRAMLISISPSQNFLLT